MTKLLRHLDSLSSVWPPEHSRGSSGSITTHNFVICKPLLRYLGNSGESNGRYTYMRTFYCQTAKCALACEEEFTQLWLRKLFDLFELLHDGCDHVFSPKCAI
mmetsp:Transcript_65791/g.144302  ORF Transcript_65791/g.144302 Transcript_65791/m.144302 type:complete len:103 (+) Transcript_65791:1195-1503(+)